MKISAEAINPQRDVVAELKQRNLEAFYRQQWQRTADKFGAASADLMWNVYR